MLETGVCERGVGVSGEEGSGKRNGHLHKVREYEGPVEFASFQTDM